MNKTVKKGLLIAGISVASIALIIGIVFLVKFILLGWDFKENTKKELRDYQSYWVCTGKLMKTDKGYIVVDHSEPGYERICFWDGKSEEYDIICKKANCNHANKKCSACFSADIVDMQYSNGYLFYAQYDKENNMHLYRSDADGTNRKEIIELLEGRDDVIDARVFVHGNDVFTYVLYSSEKNCRGKILHFDMEKWWNGDLERVVCDVDNIRSIYIEDVVGDKVLYSVEGEDFTDICEYNIETFESNKIKDIRGKITFARYMKDTIVHSSYNGIVSIANSGNEEKVLVSKSRGQIAVYGEYLYKDNTPMFFPGDESAHEVSVYDIEGDLKHTISMPEGSKEKLMICFFGDEDKLFASEFSLKQIYVMNKNEMNKNEWKVVSQSEK